MVFCFAAKARSSYNVIHDLPKQNAHTPLGSRKVEPTRPVPIPPRCSMTESSCVMSGRCAAKMQVIGLGSGCAVEPQRSARG
jgi:hypothetical protein